MVEMNKNYWQERQHKREAKAYSKILDVEKEYKEALERAKININKQISHIGTTYMKDNQLSYAEAMKQLKGAEYKVWRKELHEYMQEWKKLEKEAPLEAKKLWLEIETLSARSRISHLDTIRAQIDIELSKVSTEAVESTRKTLYGVYGDTYKEVVGDLGVKSMFSNEIAKAVIDRPWSGANYSSRLWGNSERLARVLKQEVTTGMIQGINLKTMGKRISDKIEGAKKNDVERLLRTEVNYTLNQATLDGYKDAKVEKYEFDATLDSRTSQICAELNGEVFEVNKAAVGVNYPPMHPRCFDKKTEIFTNNGWKLFENLSHNDLVYTINRETLIPKWQKPINYVSYHYKGKMLSFSGNSFDLVVTPNHNMLVQNMDSSVKDRSWKLKQANKIGRKSKHRFLSGCIWTGKKKKFEILAGKKVEIETYLKFMAYWLADGSCTADRGSYNVKIAQNDNEWMYEELKKLPFKIYKCKESLMIRDKELGEELKQYGKCTEKYIPDNIKDMNSELIRIFLLAYSKTDGTLKKGKFWKHYQFRDSICFFTTSNKLSGDLGELILKAGGRPSYYLEKCKGKKVFFRNGCYALNENLWRISWNTRIHSWISNLSVENIDYDDYVYCVEVEKYNTILVRRNGKVTWSGNCRSTTSPIIDYEVLGKRLREEKEQKEIVSESSFSKQVKESIEKELGKLNTDSVILRKERLQHIEERHPEAVEIIKNNFDKIIENPDYVLKDGKNENTILLIRELESKAYNTVIKISVKENTELKNSTLTFYKIRDREVRRLCNISKVILTKK